MTTNYKSNYETKIKIKIPMHIKSNFLYINLAKILFVFKTFKHT